MPAAIPPGLLVDTWWYSLTQRMTHSMFIDLAKLRKQQGFNAVQLVMGIPPEVGIDNPNAASEAGTAWDLSGNINADYLKLAEERIRLLTEMGFTTFVYGAWGYQIDWIGVEGMTRWWSAIIEHVDDLDVIYSLTGESNLRLNSPDAYQPDKTAQDVLETTPDANYQDAALKRQRVEKWSAVLDAIMSQTEKPFITHPNASETSLDTVTQPEKLAAITVQTGHSEQRRNDLWQMPLDFARSHPNQPFINLEPWYEGILGSFHTRDQLFALWASLLAGAHGFCYGAHGLWNVGDGQFLGYWGDQTFDQAVALKTPQLLGISHELFYQDGFSGPASVTTQQDKIGFLVWIRRQLADRVVTFYPTVTDDMPEGRYFSPLEGKFIPQPIQGQPIVVLQD